MTARWSGYTLTSPTPYVYYATLGHGQCGSVHTNVLLPIFKDKVGTSVFRDRLVVESLDCRHLAYTTIGSYSVPLVPLSRYFDEKLCELSDEGYNTVSDNWSFSVFFTPYPEALVAVDSAWKYCTAEKFMAYDPPIFLTPTIMESVQLHPITASIRTVPSYYAPSSTASDAPAREGVVHTFAPATPTNKDILSTPSNVISTPPKDEFRATMSNISIITIIASPMDVRHHPSGRISYEDGPLHGFPWNFEPGDSLTQKGGSLQENVSPLQDFPPSGQSIYRVAVFVISGQTYTATQSPFAPGTFALNGTTFSLGGSAITINSAEVSAVGAGFIVQATDLAFDQTASSTYTNGTRIIGYNGGGSMEAGKVGPTGRGKKNKAGRSFFVAWHISILGTSPRCFHLKERSLNIPGERIFYLLFLRETNMITFVLGTREVHLLWLQQKISGTEVA